MIRLVVGLTSCLFAAALTCFPRSTDAAETAPPAASMPVPADYRQWIYLTSGLDMTYEPTVVEAMPPDHNGQFDNVFVNPDAYRTFTRTARWPSGTTFVLENRAAVRNASINRSGRTQGTEVTGIELHVKTGKDWAFYARQADGAEHLIARPASCYSCHEKHAAVDTTFVQFYPTLLPIAQSRHTFSPEYLAASRHDSHD